jgi:hypothetical protein
VCTHIGRGLQLKDVVIQALFEMLWKKFGENNQKVIKISQIISQMFAPRLKHDKI